ncbi:MAG TPA: MarR family transcriptional regulator [Deltaproteobacteria bacterium]|nr:MarR family transcriptional regulator [Deltaproteobacteria bacterium]
MSDKRLLFKFTRAHHLLLKQVEKTSLEILGITPVQLGAIFFLLNHDGCQQKDLSAGLSLNYPAVTGLVARMIKSGLLTKESCSRDGRASRLYLSEKARAIAPESFPLVEELNKRLTEGFSSEEIDTVHRFLDAIIINAQGGTTHE